MGIFSANISSSHAFISFLCNFWLLFSSPHSSSLRCFFNKLERRGNDDNCPFCYRFVSSLISSCRKPSVFPSGISPREREREKEWADSRPRCTSEVITRLRSSWDFERCGPRGYLRAIAVPEVLGPFIKPHQILRRENHPTAVSIIARESQELTDIHESARVQFPQRDTNGVAHIGCS